eukprot:812244_1
MALSFVSYAFAVFHIRHHDPSFLGRVTVLIKPFLDLFDSIFAIPIQPWIVRHQGNHHVYTNSADDNDVCIADPFFYIGHEYGFKYRFYHAFQTVYAPFLLAISQWTRVWDHVFTSEGGNPIFIPVYYALLIGLPFWNNQDNHSLSDNVLNYLLFETILSLTLGYIFIISHNNGLLKHNGKINLDDYDLWVKSQIEESLSWSNDVTNVMDYVVTVMLGGINTQIEHHIAPALVPIYYLFATNDIKRICTRHHITYNESDNFFTAASEFHLYLLKCERY